ncbi:MFS transporter, partial [Azospirillum brasilense]|nr:MFS transporter [Azospirillum brasilense]
MTAITNDDTPTARNANPPADAGGETAASRAQT